MPPQPCMSRQMRCREVLLFSVSLYILLSLPFSKQVRLHATAATQLLSKQTVKDALAQQTGLVLSSSYGYSQSQSKDGELTP